MLMGMSEEEGYESVIHTTDITAHTCLPTYLRTYIYITLLSKCVAVRLSIYLYTYSWDESTSLGT